MKFTQSCFGSETHSTSDNLGVFSMLASLQSSISLAKNHQHKFHDN